jgi:CheY-like chemotaxis protein
VRLSCPHPHFLVPFVCCSEYAADGKAAVEMVRSRLHPPAEAKAGHGHDQHGSSTGTGTGAMSGSVAAEGPPVAAFDCVLLDRALPLVNGLLTAKALREQVTARAALLHLLASIRQLMADFRSFRLPLLRSLPSLPPLTSTVSSSA